MKDFARFFSHTFILSGGGGGGPGPASAPASWQPLVDIYECPDSIRVVAELPGVDKKRIRVTVEHGVLRIEGYRNPVVPDSARNVHQMEIPYGHFFRAIRLPRSIDVDRINAKHEKGYLKMVIPRNKPR